LSWRYLLITIVGGLETAFTLTTAARLPVPAIAPATATAASATIPDPIRSLRTFKLILSGRPTPARLLHRPRVLDRPGRIARTGDDISLTGYPSREVITA
jgi:hypothetical protein